MVMAQEVETDESVARRVQNGDKNAFGILIERYEGKMLSYAKRFLANREDRQDLVQDVFIKVYENINDFDTERKFSPWIYRIAHNTFVNELKAKGRRPIAFDLFSTDLLFPSQDGGNAQEEAIHREVKKELETKLDMLDPKYSEPLILYYFEDLSYDEISEVLHLPVATVGVRLKRGREMLRKHYQGQK